MSKAFAIDFVRQIVEQTLLEEHIKNPTKYVGGVNQVNLFSFYEQLEQQDEIDRFTERYRDLINQQNRSGLIANGVIVSPENPTITNLNQATIIPLTFTITFRCTLANRDLVLDTLNHLIDIHKGRKIDIAETNTNHLFKVGTFGNNVNGNPLFKDMDFIDCPNLTNINTYMNNLIVKGVELDTTKHYYVYCEKNGALQVADIHFYGGQQQWSGSFVVDDNTHPDIVFPPTNTSFRKWKLSISFDSTRCDEPRTLNANEYCNISLGGSATLVDAKVRLGNDILKLGIQKKFIKGSPNIDLTALSGNELYWLEPLEIPSSSNANTMPSQLLSNAFKTNSHTDSLNLSLQYTFIVDTEIALIDQFYDYARYGKIALDNSGISPNMIYEITEFYNSWGKCKVEKFNAKVVESVDIDNTESDTLSITIPFQIQGDND